VRTADARLYEQLRHATSEHHTVFEPVVRDAEVPVVADERRAHESRIAVVAACVDPERHAESSGPYTEQASTRTEVALAEGLDELSFPSVRIRGAEHIRAHRIHARDALPEQRRITSPAIAPRGFGEELNACRRLAEQPQLRRDRADVFARKTGGQIHFGRNRRLCASRYAHEGDDEQRGDDVEWLYQWISKG
jgi:hypothetical protein